MREMKTFSRAMSQRVWRAAESLALVAGSRRSLLFFEPGDLLLVLDQRVDAGHGGLDAGLHHFFGELFLVEDHHFFDVAHAALEVFAQGHNLANHDGRARDGLEHAQLAALNALGDFDFAFAREQRNRAHLAQVHAHRVVGFFQRARRQVELDVFALFQLEVLVAGKFGAVEQVDALGADGGDQVVQIVGRANLIRQHVVHVAVGEIALFLADFDQAVNLVFEFVFNRQNAPALLRNQIQHRLRTGAWSESRTREKKISVWKSRNSSACGHRPAVTRKKEAVSGSCSEQDDKRFRFRLGRPRAEAHGWGRGARILTEINRLPQSASAFSNAKSGGS